MSHKRDKAVKRTPQTKTAEEILESLKAQITRFNAVYAADYGDTLELKWVDSTKKENDALNLVNIAYTQQEMLDAMHWTLAEYYGYGETRQKAFHDNFSAKFDEIHEFKKKHGVEYTEAKTEEALKKACGKYYEPAEERYHIRMIDEKGNVIFDSKEAGLNHGIL